MIYLASDLEYVNENTKDEIIRDCEEIGYMLASWIRKSQS